MTKLKLQNTQNVISCTKPSVYFLYVTKRKNTPHNTIPDYNNTVIVCNNNDYSTVITTVGNYIKNKKKDTNKPNSMAIY